MVFPGRFSTGCLRCRQRKVKCDEARPSCRRCCIYGKPCPGYTDQFQFRHRGTQLGPGSSAASAQRERAGAAAAGAAGNKQGLTQVSKAPERQGSRQSPPVLIKIEHPGPEVQQLHQQQQLRRQQQHQRQETVEQEEQQAHQQRQRQQQDQHQHQHQHQHQQLQQGAVQTVPWDRALVRAPDPSYDDVSLSYFVRRFVSPNPTDGFPGHLSFLPSLYDSHSQGLLEAATLTVAQMAAYNKFGGERFRVQSYRNYGRAIRMLQDIIRSEHQATDDRVITSVLLLCTLKDISGEGSGDPGEHAPGLYYLVEKRGPEQIATSRGAELLFLALIRLQVYSFLHDDDTYVDPGSIATAWGAFDPLLRALSMMSRTLSLRKRLLSPGAEQPPLVDDPVEQAAVLHGCFETLDAFHRWDEEAAEYWKTTFEGRAVPTALGEVAPPPSSSAAAAGSGGPAPQHYDVETACTIILTRSERLILLVSMIAYHYYQERDGRGAETGLAECVPVLGQHVGMAIDDILASVPYALGDVGPGGVPSSLAHDGAAAIVIVQSIRLVASCAFASPAQLRSANDVLARINAGIGIRAAAGLLEEDMVRSSWVREQAFLRECLARESAAMMMATTPTTLATTPTSMTTTATTATTASSPPPAGVGFTPNPHSPGPGPGPSSGASPGCWAGDPFASPYVGRE
ncbi:uncharacterized protein P884DRAFT_223917 [Thermothelomyces heterothallicus CBS 202.75]|uniref:uncharacterized protein n=1 Tax=Thermothelomyces heterothallicus CBS 202.75 TaxID=1149848 RepID=UPI0037427049